ncbi:MAG: hypothetical protein LBH59_03115 [Planctomycetaceae bacterium]|jgi:hypothetical protein|nr:hypothetical protein [Planctomycetaceae bacterium]
MKRIFLFFAAIISFAFFMGCNEKLPSNMPQLYQLTLTVIQDGKPLDKATVQLVRKDTKSQWGGTGFCDASGNAEIYTQGKYKGVPAGIYSIIVTKYFTEPSKYEGQPIPDPKKDLTAYEDWMRALDSENLISYSLVELKYGSVDTTPLSIEVGKNEKPQPIDVGKSVRLKIQKEKN